MFRRQPKDELDPVGDDAEPAPAARASDDFTPWEEWEGNWAKAEEERVARWLADRFGLQPRSVLEEQVDRLSSALDPDRLPGPERLTHPVFGLDEADIEDRQRRLQSGTALTPIDGDLRHPGLPADAGRHDVEIQIGELRVERDALEAEARDAAVAVEEARMALEALEEKRLEVAGALDAERSALATLHDERRRLITAFQADQLELERVRLLQAETRVRLEDEVTALEQRRRRLQEGDPDPA